MSGEEKGANKRGRKRRNFDSSDDEEDEVGPNEPGEEAKFRFNARKVFLTYPRCNIAPGDVPRFFPLWNEIKSSFCKQELHLDGELHLHLFCSFGRKLNSTNARMFDMVVGEPVDPQGDVRDPVRFHPNIKRVNGPEDLVRIWEYLCKDGREPLELAGKVDLYKFSKNFCASYRDRESWLAYRQSVSQDVPRWPIVGPAGQLFPDPRDAGKKRNLWLQGAANAGKTQWLEAKVYCFRNYKVGDSRYPFDNYSREQIIVYDDVVPRASDLLVLGNHSAYPRPVPGATRYHQRFIPGGLYLWTVVCSNKTIDERFEGEGAEVISALHSRFITVTLEPAALD